jgi:Membrane-bound metallopeptidase
LRGRDAIALLMGPIAKSDPSRAAITRISDQIDLSDKSAREEPALASWPTEIESREVIEGFQNVWRRIADGDTAALKKSIGELEETINRRINPATQVKISALRIWPILSALLLGLIGFVVRNVKRRADASLQAQLDSEKARHESEHARLASERARQESEQARLASEEARQQSEQARLASEKARQESEQARLASEEARRQSERARSESGEASVGSERARKIRGFTAAALGVVDKVHRREPLPGSERSTSNRREIRSCGSRP